MKIIENSECFDDLSTTFFYIFIIFLDMSFRFLCPEVALEELCKFVLDLKSM